MDNDLLSIADAASMLSLHPRTIRRHVREGVIRGVKIGGEWRIRRQDLVDALGDRSLVNDLDRSWELQLVDFIRGNQPPGSGKYQVCSIVDCDFTSPEEASKVSESLIYRVNNRQSDSPVRFQYIFDPGRKTRFILWGDPDFIREMMECLSRQQEGK